MGNLNIAINTEILDLLTKIKFKHMGRDESGLDCSGLVYFIHKLQGIELPIYDEGINYSEKWEDEDADRLERTLGKISKVIPYDEKQVGNILCFRIRHNKINHLGIYIGNEKFIHSFMKFGVSISNLNHFWLRTLKEVREII